MKKEIYVNQLAIQQQEQVEGYLRDYFINEYGLSGIDLDEAVLNGMQSKVADVEYILVVTE